jgi:hypothetical protein
MEEAVNRFRASSFRGHTTASNEIKCHVIFPHPFSSFLHFPPSQFLTHAYFANY